MFQAAEDQHLYDLSPMVWFVHFRGVGSPVKLARAVHSLILATSTPLPQAPPAHPTTPLPAEELGHILGGDASVGENGVVTVDVPRTDTIRLGGHVINPLLNVMTNIQFQPMGKNGHAVVVSDIGMTADEVMPVMRTLRAYGWLSECLYNQETDEYPQLYFDHFFKTGDAVALARQLRQALNHTNV